MASSRFVPFVDLCQQHDPLHSELMAAIAAVVARGDYILGESVVQFEQAFATACNACHGVGVGSGTDALTLGLQACGVGPGDQVILPVNTFVATLIGVLQVGAIPVFVDCDLETGLMDLAAAEQAITRRTRAIIPVHLYGQMVSPQALRSLAETYDVIIFEDAAQAHGAEREGKKAGSVGLAAAFSFYPSKNLGAMGDGGMVTTQNDLVAQTVRSLRNYGSTRKYYHTDPGGTNSRLDTLQAAILQIKLAYLASWNCDRNRLAKLYDDALKPLANYGLVPMLNQSGSGHVYHLYVIRLTQDCSIDRTRLQQELATCEIQSGIHYPVPCHLQPAFHNLGYRAGDFPVAEQLSQEILSLPMYPGMSNDQLQYVVETIAGGVQACPVLI
ncbi:DegT/DnrJ/EryC1/StrS family aminotransferase [Leptolyngbyaceae cyanobacterium CCMR0082]|uniref:DegT/DnrJ/EryC1/StrS family aminotransferase n=2 Tax=Adonisia turfae TaxID=2950184 RepID=A0A6M0S0C5_9CYAN|nr:DegT/DnrJ/EryC1/StrS family aminotransferase [Adonisia turfae]MDV3350888.1 DegT/DnrJ/EryC1/StrS family aminotransferase [Leptothoe sp. LEGE 181152]NEZ60168.1 DegT/DnrJ/EryC1/StrS family aminotransferase [Adonisia turfae CCMR0081]NEZ61905.1 DegT/DnrJ/EryC1/StrS family aminotransferase [Adonisia turfae CCMR0082]